MSAGSSAVTRSHLGRPPRSLASRQLFWTRTLIPNLDAPQPSDTAEPRFPQPLTTVNRYFLGYKIATDGCELSPIFYSLTKLQREAIENDRALGDHRRFCLNFEYFIQRAEGRHSEPFRCFILTDHGVWPLYTHLLPASVEAQEMLSYIGLLKMQGRINDPAALEHQESDENSLYTRFISFEHISQVLGNIKNSGRKIGLFVNSSPTQPRCLIMYGSNSLLMERGAFYTHKEWVVAKNRSYDLLPASKQPVLPQPPFSPSEFCKILDQLNSPSCKTPPHLFYCFWLPHIGNIIEAMQMVIQLATLDGTVIRKAEEGSPMQPNKPSQLIDEALYELWQKYLAATNNLSIYTNLDSINYGSQLELCVRINNNIFMSPLRSIQEEVQQSFSRYVKIFLQEKIDVLDSSRMFALFGIWPDHPSGTFTPFLADMIMNGDANTNGDPLTHEFFLLCLHQLIHHPLFMDNPLVVVEAASNLQHHQDRQEAGIIQILPRPQGNHHPVIPSTLLSGVLLELYIATLELLNANDVVLPNFVFQFQTKEVLNIFTERVETILQDAPFKYPYLNDIWCWRLVQPHPLQLQGW